MNKNEIDNFVNSIARLQDMPKTLQVEYFLYFLTVIKEKPDATGSEINACFDLAEMDPPANINRDLFRKTNPDRNGKKRLTKTKNGYKFLRSARLEIEKSLGINRVEIEISGSLRDLTNKVYNNDERNFLKETILCYEAKAYRAAVVMVWILTVDHLQEFIFQKNLNDFNAALKKDTSASKKVGSINKLPRRKQRGI
jgi:DNA modification methylase